MTSSGRSSHGDTILAHITPAEARMLKARGGAGTTNPATGLLEFYNADKKHGSYIWRTSGDSKVRSSHAGLGGFAATVLQGAFAPEMGLGVVLPEVVPDFEAERYFRLNSAGCRIKWEIA